MGTCIAGIAVRRWIGATTNDPRAARRRLCGGRSVDRPDRRGLMMGVKLKPCPFCGNKANIFTINNDNVFIPKEEVSKENNYSVRCLSCFCGTGLYRDINRVIEAWNRRIDDDRL